MTTAPAETEKRRLSGRLGPVGIVFMVVAAAAPLTVIGGNMPLAMGLGNGAGAPVGFVIAALVAIYAIYGLASHGSFLGAFKPGNRSRQVKGLYLAGGAAQVWWAGAGGVVLVHWCQLRKTSSSVSAP